MIVTEDNGVIRIVTSTDELVEAVAALDQGEPCEFEEAGGRRTIVFVEEVEADVAEPSSPSIDEEYDRVTPLISQKVRLGDVTGVLVRATKVPATGVEVEVVCVAPHHPQEPCPTRTGWSVDLTTDTGEDVTT